MSYDCGQAAEAGDTATRPRSRIVTPDGKTAVYRYQETSTDEAYLLKWGYIEGKKAGTNEMVDKIKTRLGLYEA